MRLLRRFFVLLLLLSAVAVGAYPFVSNFLRERRRVAFATVEADSGDVEVTVSATGKIEPKLKVQIGAFVSGPIIELHADFNDEVQAGDVLAKIDPAIYQANVRRDEAALATRKSDVQRIEANLELARKNEFRGVALHEENPNFIAQAELDRLKFGRMALEAELQLAQASVEQAEASLQNSRANLNYTSITAPRAGKVIDRKIDPGQTLAATFQTPELFVLGVDMDKEMFIYASVDEAEIGMIRQAQASEQPVHFRVSAYPEELFEGRIHEIRMSSTETQNVVTYPVVVAAPNPDLKLLPGMTATLTFQVEAKSSVLRIPWAALRFFPKPEQVRDEDRKLLEGAEEDESGESSEEAQVAAQPTVGEIHEARQNERRHVWVQDGELLRAIEVRLGASDYQYAECAAGDVKAGMKLVTGLKKK